MSNPETIANLEQLLQTQDTTQTKSSSDKEAEPSTNLKKKRSATPKTRLFAPSLRLDNDSRFVNTHGALDTSCTHGARDTFFTVDSELPDEFEWWMVTRHQRQKNGSIVKSYAIFFFVPECIDQGFVGDGLYAVLTTQATGHGNFLRGLGDNCDMLLEVYDLYAIPEDMWEKNISIECKLADWQDYEGEITVLTYEWRLTLDLLKDNAKTVSKQDGDEDEEVDEYEFQDLLHDTLEAKLIGIDASFNAVVSVMFENVDGEFRRFITLLDQHSRVLCWDLWSDHQPHPVEGENLKPTKSSADDSDENSDENPGVWNGHIDSDGKLVVWSTDKAASYTLQAAADNKSNELKIQKLETQINDNAAEKGKKTKKTISGKDGADKKRSKT